MRNCMKAGFILGITLLATLAATLIQRAYAAIEDASRIAGKEVIAGLRKASIATSGDNNAYVVSPKYMLAGGNAMPLPMNQYLEEAMIVVRHLEKG